MGSFCESLIFTLALWKGKIKVLLTAWVGGKAVVPRSAKGTQSSPNTTENLPALKFESQTQFKPPFFYIFYSSWGIKFGLSAPLRAVHSHSQPRAPSSEQAAAPHDCTQQTHLLSSSRHWRLGIWEMKDEVTDTFCSNSVITAGNIFKAWNPWQSQDGEISFPPHN